MILLDMCVVSDPRRQVLHPWVIAWIDAQPEETLVLSTIIAPELNDPPDAEQDGDISDDPRLSTIDRDLTSVSKRNDKQLQVILLVLVPLTFVYERSAFKGVWIDAAFLGLLFGAIGYVILRLARQKQTVAARYGLVCRVCGKKPKAHMVLSAAMTQHCARCGSKLRG